ncbi:MAG: hypothetical protein WD988_04750, partial [Candidatus Curtissbacteria bacterium]
VGQKGVRVQAVINELGDEKIDVIAYQEDIGEFIKAALSPAKELQVKVDEATKIAEVTAPDDQLSLAIGKEGQNVRLAAKLTGYKIDIRGKSGTPKEVEAKEKAAQEEARKAFGVGTEEQKPKEAGTKEKTSSVGDTDKPTDDVPKGDKEPLLADAEEKKEEQEAEEVVQELKVEEMADKPDQAVPAEEVPADLDPVEPEDAKVLQERQEENESKPDSSGGDK